MARTQASDYDQRREAILEHAAELFARRGFNGASIAELATACKISKSLIYHYYPSKEDILYEIMLSHVEALTEAVAKLNLGHGPAREQLHQLIVHFLELYMGAKHGQKVLLDELDYLPEVRRKEIIDKQRNVVAAVSGLLALIQPQLARDKHRLTATTMLLFGMINWTKNWFHPNGAISPLALADLATQTILGGVDGLTQQGDNPTAATSAPRLRQL